MAKSDRVLRAGDCEAMSYKRKLIEVALPLDAISAASAREKSIRHGHPSTLHLWWARRPLAAARAVLWSSLVDDPSAHPDRFPTEEDQAVERKRLFEILEKLVVWENSNNPEVLAEARAEIVSSCGGGGRCRMCWIRSAVVERFRWRRSGSDCLPMAVISIR